MLSSRSSINNPRLRRGNEVRESVENPVGPAGERTGTIPADVPFIDTLRTRGHFRPPCTEGGAVARVPPDGTASDGDPKGFGRDEHVGIVRNAGGDAQPSLTQLPSFTAPPPPTSFGGSAPRLSSA